MELNSEQILKALECCTGLDGTNYCDNCPYFSEKSHDCTQMLSDALALIKELTDEYETLHGTYTELTRKVEELTVENNKLRAEVSIKRMFLDVAVGGIKRERIYTVREIIATIKEKAENCGLYVVDRNEPIDTIYQISKTQLDQIAQEMLEGK